jgi:hypothetical protein
MSVMRDIIYTFKLKFPENFEKLIFNVYLIALTPTIFSQSIFGTLITFVGAVSLDGVHAGDSAAATPSSGLIVSVCKCVDKCVKEITSKRIQMNVAITLTSKSNLCRCNMAVRISLHSMIILLYACTSMVIVCVDSP